MIVTKLIPAAALALSLLVFTSCKVENLTPDLEPYFKEITGTDTTTFMTSLTSATATSSGSNTSDFQDGFKAGYAAGYTEAAKRNQPVTTLRAEVPEPAAPVPSPTPVGTTMAAVSSSNIPSWGYTSDTSSIPEPAAKPKPAKSTSSNSSKYSRYSRSRSGRNCSGGS